MNKINLNDLVRVKLTARGLEIYETYYDSPPILDEGGFYRLSLASLASIFGPHLYVGMTTSELPFENNEVLVPEGVYKKL